MPRCARAGEVLLARIHAQNSGSLAWAPFSGGRSAQIQLGYHLFDCNGSMLQWDFPRFPMMRFVPPGDTAVFLCTFWAPAMPGDYLLEWDLVSESECWFGDCGGKVVRTPLAVVT